MWNISWNLSKQEFETPDPQRYCNATVNENLELLPRIIDKS